MENCQFCTGKISERQPLMKNGEGNYYVIINRFNYLEDSEVGDFTAKFSLFGEKIRFCPMCGRNLKDS